MTADQPEGLRASDADRERVSRVLAAAYADGRLTLDEHDQRLDLVLRAKTFDDLTALTRDLARPGHLPDIVMPSGTPIKVDGGTVVFGRIGRVFLPIGIGLLVLAGIAALLLDGPALIAVVTSLGVLGLVGAIQGTTFLAVQRHFFGSVAALKQVAVTGHQTVATIVNVHRTMSQIGSEPVVRLDLTVGGRAVTRHVLVPFNHIGDVRPGKELPVRIDPNDPRTMIVEWHRLVGQQELTDGAS